MGKAKARQLKDRWAERGLEPAADTGSADPRERLIAAACAATIGQVRAIARWQCAEKVCTETTRCSSCHERIWQNDNLLTFADVTGQVAPVVAHDTCKFSTLSRLGGQQEVKPAYPHELSYTDPVGTALGNASPDIDGMSAKVYVREPVDPKAYGVFINDAVLRLLRTQRPELPGLEA